MYTKSIFELLLESGKLISSEIELEKVVQRATDLATEMAGAEFGAFFYDVTNAAGESFMLYTISGVSREAFSKFPMPRNTKIFDPTFTARGTVRYDDVTEQPQYGQNPPYDGMPKGHLPVKSYLAVPVVSPVTKEPIGGLFFGHSQPKVFTEQSQKLVEGIAIQAAIAMTNAHLFEEKKQTERRLLEQKEQYLSIFNATSDSIIIYDENGFIAEANPSACQIFGYAYAELIGTHASRLFQNPSDFQVLKEIAFSGRQYRGTNTRIRKDGTLFEADFKGSRFLFRGKPHVMSAVKDITWGKQTEEALQKTRDFAQLISNISPVVLWMTNAEGQTIYINQTWTDWTGGTQESHLDQGWLNGVEPEDRTKTQEAFLQAFAARKVFTADFRIRRRDGEVRWCSTHGSPYFGQDGTFGGFVGSLSDITERKLAEEKLESQNVLINTIMGTTLQALFLMDDRQICTYMNPAAEQMTGYTLEEVQGKPLHYYIHHTRPDGSHYPMEECAINCALPSRNQTRGEEVFVRKDGSFVPVAFIASPIIENGVPKGTVIEARDTTEEKKIQQALRNKEKETLALLEQKVKERTAELEKRNYELLQFASVASHDLKEPVRKITLFSKLLTEKLQPSLDARTLRQLDTITSSAQRMTRLIDDLLNFSRLSQNRLSFEPVDLNAVLGQIAEDLEVLIQEKGACVHWDPLPTVEGIPLQLGQVFQNLISNSLKFCPEGRKPLVTIKTEEISENGEKSYRILYQDNGIGFDPEQAEKIFEIFFRLHSRDQYEGTGVGLAIVKKIVEMHQGSIKATAVRHQGARFELVFPRPR
ncbi:PAS domain S-box protein [Paraflavisolibacter sp. H34]|uniref:PAS domain S-box protein n=1 Tax=Huijunlia imazamoxiresistens TaxID=3127457 RepID=UPI003017531A